mgnify:CR=1 FL=1
MKKVLIIVIICFSIDFIIMQFFGKKVNDLMYGKYDTSNKIAYRNRIKNHHELKENQKLERKWHKVYIHKTDEFGNRIGDCIVNDKNKKNIFIVGDSMVEGIGINYENTFVGLLNCHFDDLNILNLGVATYSPIIYYEKIKEVILKYEKPDSVFIFLGINDIQDEANYTKINNRIVDITEKNYFDKNLIYGYWLNDIKFFLKNNFIFFKFLDLVKDKYEKKNKKVVKKKVVQKNINANIGINHPKTIWTFDNESYMKYGKKGLFNSLLYGLFIFLIYAYLHSYANSKLS